MSIYTYDIYIRNIHKTTNNKPLSFYDNYFIYINLNTFIIFKVQTILSILLNRTIENNLIFLSIRVGLNYANFLTSITLAGVAFLTIFILINFKTKYFSYLLC